MKWLRIPLYLASWAPAFLTLAFINYELWPMWLVFGTLPLHICYLRYKIASKQKQYSTLHVKHSRLYPSRLFMASPMYRVFETLPPSSPSVSEDVWPVIVFTKRLSLPTTGNIRVLRFCDRVYFDANL